MEAVSAMGNASDLKTIIQKLNEIKSDADEKFLFLKHSMEQIQAYLFRLKADSYNPQTTATSKTNHTMQDAEYIELQKKVLQENFEHMVKDIDLENTGLLDDLQEAECLTSDEASEIIRKPRRRDQVRKLVLHLRRKSGEKFIKFVEKLQKSSNYPHLASDLMKSYNTKRTALCATTEIQRCIVCILKRDVLPKDVIDKLYINDLVPTRIYELIVDDLADDTWIWDTILTHLKLAIHPRKCRQVLQEALARKYEHISAAISKTHFPEILCHCKNLKSAALFIPKSLPSNSAGSLGDVSTTSEQKISLSIHDGFSLRGTPSVNSENSENSTQIDYQNIPNTVKWLESIPSGNAQDETASVSEQILIDLVDAASVVSLDMDSVSKCGIQNAIDEETQMEEGTNCSKINPKISNSYDSNSTFQPSYANVLCGRSGVSEKSRTDTRQSHSSTCKTVMSSDQITRPLSSKIGKSVNKPVESLSEIGTMYLSKHEAQDFGACVSDNVEIENMKGNRRKKSPCSFQKQKRSYSTSGIEVGKSNIRNTNQNSNMATRSEESNPNMKGSHLDTPGKSVLMASSGNTSQTHRNPCEKLNLSKKCQIMEHLFYEEQQKIHGKCATENRLEQSATNSCTVNQGLENTTHSCSPLKSMTDTSETASSTGSNQRKKRKKKKKK